MDHEEKLFELLKDLTRTNTQVLDRLDDIKTNTHETQQTIAELNGRFQTVVEKYEHFSELMRLNTALVAGVIFSIITLAIAIVA